jgi:hypothetical protein
MWSLISLLAWVLCLLRASTSFLTSLPRPWAAASPNQQGSEPDLNLGSIIFTTIQQNPLQHQIHREHKFNNNKSNPRNLWASSLTSAHIDLYNTFFLKTIYMKFFAQ